VIEQGKRRLSDRRRSPHIRRRYLLDLPQKSAASEIGRIAHPKGDVAKIVSREAFLIFTRTHRAITARLVALALSLGRRHQREADGGAEEKGMCGANSPMMI